MKKVWLKEIWFKKTEFVKFTCYVFMFIFILLGNYKAIAGEAEITPFSKIEVQNRVIKAPKAYFTNSDFTFEPVEDGKKVYHDFTVKNIGNSTLLIKSVKTDCGCTAVNYDREILAGEEGKIRINLDTTGYANKTISKSVRVHTNDPENSIKELKISGLVEILVNISPRIVRLSGNGSYSSNMINGMGHNIEMRVKITPSVKYPFSITALQLYDGTNINAEFKASNLPTGSWDVIVRNIRKKAGRYFDEITLKTDSKIVSDIKIKVIGNITD
ncbi:MAG: DUF1573 domain-containing protein [Desulfamplus sp.]|nr:DUF1573 domain-containing protein [Desulfamplus sp.]